MKTLILSTAALTFNVGTFINAELAFGLLTAAGVIGITANDYAPQSLVTGIEA